MDKNKVIATKSIHDLLGEKFYIPNYQRGYRWTEIEVKKLVDDLYRYFNEEKVNKDTKEKSYYCLQPLVVKKRDDDSWELIDGQQRMTTIFLLLKCLMAKRDKIRMDQITRNDLELKLEIEELLAVADKAFPEGKKSLFQMIYQTREDSMSFLETIDKIDKIDYKCVDYFYISNAYLEIEKYFSQKKSDRKLLKFLSNIVDDSNRVRFIWYNVTDECKNRENYAKELFSRLNIGKIPLTNAELIKSLFLNDIYGQLLRSGIIDENNKDISVNNKEQYYKALDSQLEYRIAGEWDMVEQKLNDSEFWAFLYGKEDGKYQTRIELIFDLIVGKKQNEKDKYFTFSEYDEMFKKKDDKADANKNPDNLFSCKKWHEVMDLFYTFCSWYEERDIYHYVGFLRNKGIDLLYIKGIYEDVENYSTFLDVLRNEAFYSIGIKNRKDESINDILTLSYSDDKTCIKDILILFNIESIRKTRSEERFSFSSFYSQDYDIEHIKPQTPKEFETDKDKECLIRSCLEYLTGIQYLDRDELSEIQREKFLKDYAESLQDRKIMWLINKRKRQNPHTVSGKKLINAIDNQLFQYAPRLKHIKVKEDSCKVYFIKELEKHEAITNPCESDQSKLIIKLYKKYKDIYNGKSVELNFTKKEKNILGIEDDSGPDTIGNLVLLDRGTNRSYKNSSFIVKRYYIQKREENGVYVPRSTRDVFNKLYSLSVAEPMRWTEKDMEDYANAIMEVLK